MAEEESVKLVCPYCNSKKISSDEEYRFCCVFKHGEKTLEDLEPKVIMDNLIRISIPFICENCGKEFHVVYKISEIVKG